ncbi:hypothetical protein C2G38_2218393 [Gigaspora rosea]|uniref:Uncharacterized protein n=1 Tax=Gigaspora rosea TaxID=44941 RepID=A0A397U6H8_9GLOM|nr:hypothetical protein C2G38_2218393 [Gigaspora rosea]
MLNNGSPVNENESPYVNNNGQGALELVDQYAADMLMLFHRLERVRDQYSKSTKMEKFVQGLHPRFVVDHTSVYVNTLFEAIEKAQVCKITIAHNSIAYSFLVAYDMASNMVNSPVEQLIALLQEVVSVMSSNGNSNWSYPLPTKNHQREVKPASDNTRPPNEMNCDVNKKEREEREETKPVGLPIIADSGNGVPSRRLYDHCNDSNNCEEKYKKDTFDKGEIMDGLEDPLDDCYQNEREVGKVKLKAFIGCQNFKKSGHDDGACDLDRWQETEMKRDDGKIGAEDNGLKAVYINDQVAVHQAYIGDQKSARMGRTKGVNELGYDYQNGAEIEENGIGVKMVICKALNYYRSSAIGVCHQKGIDAIKNKSIESEWGPKSARNIKPIEKYENLEAACAA